MVNRKEWNEDIDNEDSCTAAHQMTGLWFDSRFLNFKSIKITFTLNINKSYTKWWIINIVN